MIRRLLIQNGLAVSTVILYHATAYGFIAMFWWTDRYRDVPVPNFDQLGSLTYYVLRGIEQIVIYGIPSFMFVSGFFIAIATQRDRQSIEWRIVFARIKYLVIPFLIWSAIILILRWLQGERFTPIQLFVTVITGRSTPAYYYVPLLVEMLLLSPFLVPLAKRHPGWLLSVGIVLQVFTLLLRYPSIIGLKISALEPFALLNRSWFFTIQFFWFIFGVVSGFHLQRIKPVLKRIRWIFVVMLVALFIIGIFEWEYLLKLSGRDWLDPRETLIDQIYAGFFILTILSFEEIKIPFASQWSDLGTKSYGIYLSHSLALEYTARLIYHVAPNLLAYQILFQPILIIMGFGVPLTAMALLNKSPARRYYKYLFG